MFKISSVDLSSRHEAKRILQEIYAERPDHWPYGLSLDHFDGGCYLIREKRSSVPVGFCGWQVRQEYDPKIHHSRVGYYSIGIKQAFRRNGFAKEALEKLIAMKSATCDKVRAMIAVSNKPSQALADVLGVEKMMKFAYSQPAFLQSYFQTPEYRQPSDYLKAGIPLAGIGAGFKFNADLNRIGRHMGEWSNAMEQHAKRFPTLLQGGVLPNRAGKYPGMPVAKDFVLPLEESSQAIDEYTRLGKQVAESKVMGARAGNLMAGYDRFFNPGAVEHHQMFANPNLTYKDLRPHMVEKALSARGNAWWDPKVFTPEMKEYANRIAGKTNYSMLVKAFENKFPGTAAATLLRNAIAGKPGDMHMENIGEAARLAGLGKLIRPTPSIYAGRMEQQLLRPWRIARFPLLAGGAALAYGGLHNLFSKHATAADAGDAALIAGSVPAAYYAHKGLLRPNRRIGVTWGQMANPYAGAVGEGHMGPGKALIHLLKDDPRFHNVDIDPLIRTQSGLLDVPVRPGKYNIIADTGLGAYGHDWAAPEPRSHKEWMPINLRASTHMPILTDMAASDRARLGATGDLTGFNRWFRNTLGPLSNHLPDPERQVMMGYGPHWEQVARNKGLKNLANVSPGLTPLIGESQLGVLQGAVPERAATLNGLADYYATTHPELSAQLREVAKSTNPIVTVSGSGRGDFVATRARDLSEAAARSGRPAPTILAQMAASHRDPFYRDILKGHPNVVQLPRMSGKDFINLQRLADIHWGSSGTSSAAEALLQPNVLAMPRDWGYREMDYGRKNLRIAPGTPAELEAAHNVAAGRGQFHGMQPTTTWNRGNMQYLLDQPGVLAANRGQDILDLLHNPARLAEMKGLAGQRATRTMAETLAARKAVADTVFNEMQRNIFKGRMRGGALGLGALAAGGLGLHHLFRKQEPPPNWFDRWIYNRSSQ